jgi:hypothetical protein
MASQETMAADIGFVKKVKALKTLKRGDAQARHFMETIEQNSERLEQEPRPMNNYATRITLYALRSTLYAFLLALTLPVATPAQSTDDKQATFFMGRVKYSANDGNDCGGVGQDLMRLVSRASTIKGVTLCDLRVES